MTHASRAQHLKKSDQLTAAIDEALLALREEADPRSAADLRVLIGDALALKRQPLEALPHLDRVLEEFPDHQAALSARGCANWRLKRFAAARADLERAISLDANDKIALEFLAATYRDSGEGHATDPMIDRLLVLEACPAYLLQERGKRLADAGDPRGQADLRTAAAGDDPFSAYLLLELGAELVTGEELAAYALDREKRSETAEALATYERAFAIGFAKPERAVEVTGRYARLLVAESEQERARTLTARLCEAHPDRADAWRLHGTLHADLAALQRAYELAPAESAVDYARALVAKGEPNAALPICTAELAKNPDNGPLLAVQGEAHLANGDRTQAREVWLAADAISDDAQRRRVEEFGPETGIDHFGTALTALNDYDKDEAVACWRRAIERLRTETRVPGDAAHRYLAKSLYNIAFTIENRSEDDELEPMFREAIELVPTYVDAMLALANLCLRQDRELEALALFGQSIELEPAAGQAWYYQARHFEKTGKYRRAIEAATKAIELYTAANELRFAGDAYWIRGQAHEALDETQSAISDYNKAGDCGVSRGYAQADELGFGADEDDDKPAAKPKKPKAAAKPATKTKAKTKTKTKTKVKAKAKPAAAKPKPRSRPTASRRAV